MDEITLRQIVQKILNRGESYHQLRRAIPYENAGKFKVKNEEEQQLWSECSRLIANCIIYYNANLLSKLHISINMKNNVELNEIIKNISPIAWRHVNLSGRYDFSTEFADLNIEQMTEEMESFFK